MRDTELTDMWAMAQNLFPKWQPTPEEKKTWEAYLRASPYPEVEAAFRHVYAMTTGTKPALVAVRRSIFSSRDHAKTQTTAHGDQAAINLRAHLSRVRPANAGRYAAMSRLELEAENQRLVWEEVVQNYGDGNSRNEYSYAFWLEWQRREKLAGKRKDQPTRTEWEATFSDATPEPTGAVF